MTSTTRPYHQQLLLKTTMLLLLLLLSGNHGSQATAVVDIARHNTDHYEKTAELEASTAQLVDPCAVTKDSYFGSTSYMIAQMNLVGVPTREQVIHVVVNAAFPEYCRGISSVAAPTAGLVESRSIVEPPASRGGVVTPYHQQEQEQQQSSSSSSFAATGLHFGPLGKCGILCCRLRFSLSSLFPPPHLLTFTNHPLMHACVRVQSPGANPIRTRCVVRP
jgi:hypothetical protein